MRHNAPLANSLGMTAIRQSYPGVRCIKTISTPSKEYSRVRARGRKRVRERKRERQTEIEREKERQRERGRGRARETESWKMYLHRKFSDSLGFYGIFDILSD